MKKNVNGIVWTLHRTAPTRPEACIHNADRAYNFPPDKLEALLRLALDEGFRFLSIAKLMENMNAKTGSERDIAITIDDGFKDTFEYAWPILKKLDIPFAFFVNADLIEHGFQAARLLEGDGLQAVFDVVYGADSMSVDDMEFRTITADEKRAAAGAICRSFASNSSREPDGRKSLSKILGMKLDFEKYRRKYICTWNDIAKMSADPLCTIGSHSLCHNKLSDMASLADIDFQLRESQRMIREHIGRPVEYLSYPYGSFDRRVAKIATKYYKAAFTTKGRAMKYGNNPFALPRKLAMAGVSLYDLTERMYAKGLVKSAIRLLCSIVPVKKWRRSLRNFFGA